MIREQRWHSTSPVQANSLELVHIPSQAVSCLRLVIRQKRESEVEPRRVSRCCCNAPGGHVERTDWTPLAPDGGVVFLPLIPPRRTEPGSGTSGCCRRAGAGNGWRRSAGAPSMLFAEKPAPEQLEALRGALKSTNPWCAKWPANCCSVRRRSAMTIHPKLAQGRRRLIEAACQSRRSDRAQPYPVMECLTINPHGSILEGEPSGGGALVRPRILRSSAPRRRAWR